MKLHPAGEEEVFHLIVSETSHPKAFKAKLDELINAGMTEKDARDAIANGVVMEVYYSPNQGFFLIESEAVESTIIFNPYDGIVCELEED